MKKRFVVLWIAMSIMLNGCSGSGKNAPGTSGEIYLAKNVSLWFAHPGDSSASEIPDILPESIQVAEQSLDCAFSRLNDTSTADTIREKISSGIPVRIASGKQFVCRDAGFLSLQYPGIATEEYPKASAHCEDPASHPELDSIREKGIPINPAEGKSGLFSNQKDHPFYQNFCIMDKKTVLILTSRVDKNLWGNRHSAILKINNPEVASFLTGEMDMYSRGLFGGDKPVPVREGNFSVNGISLRIILGPKEKPMEVLSEKIKDVRSQVDFFAGSFEPTTSIFSDPSNLIPALGLAASKGVAISSVFDRGIVSNPENMITHLQDNPALVYPSLEKIENGFSHYVPVSSLPNETDWSFFLLDPKGENPEVFIFTGKIHVSANSNEDSLAISIRDKKTVESFSGLQQEMQNASEDFRSLENPGNGQSGKLVITEIMANPKTVPDADGEYLEIYNSTDATLDLTGLVIADTSGKATVISGDIPAHGFALLCANPNPEENGGLTNCLEITSLPGLTNSGEEIRLINRFGITEDLIHYPSVKEGTSYELAVSAKNATANDDFSYWGSALSFYHPDNLGTPGTENTFALVFRILSLTAAGADKVAMEYSMEPEEGTALEINSYCITTSSSPDFLACMESGQKLEVKSVYRENAKFYLNTSAQEPHRRYNLFTRNIVSSGSGIPLSPPMEEFSGYEIPADLSGYRLSMTYNGTPQSWELDLSELDIYGMGPGKFRKNTFILIARSTDTFSDWNATMLKDFSSYENNVYYVDSGIAFNGNGDHLSILSEEMTVDETPSDASGVLLQRNPQGGFFSITNVDTDPQYRPLLENPQTPSGYEHPLFIWAYGEDDVAGLFTDYRSNFYLIYIP